MSRCAALLSNNFFSGREDFLRLTQRRKSLTISAPNVGAELSAPRGKAEVSGSGLTCGSAALRTRGAGVRNKCSIPESLLRPLYVAPPRQSQTHSPQVAIE